MRKLIKKYTIETVSLYLVTRVTSGIILEKGLESLFLAGLGLLAASLIIRPLINILLLPLNLITFGFFRWVSLTVALYLVTLLVPGFKITRFYFAGFTSQWFDLPPVNLTGLFSFIAFSFVLASFTGLLVWLTK